MKKHVSDLFRASDYFKLKFIPMWLTLGGLRCIAFLPYKFQLKVGSAIGFLLKLLLPHKQRIIRTNLKRCFPDKTDQQRLDITHKNYTNLGISLIEIGLCWWWPKHKLLELVEIRGLEHVENALKQNKGALLLTGHFTSLEIGARLLALYMPVQVMYRIQKNHLFDSFLYTKRSQYFENTISRKNTRQLIKGLRKKIPTWYAPDQDFRRENNMFAPFFNIPTATITATARLTKAGNATVFSYFPERKADGSGYILHIEPALENFPSDDEMADATAINQSIEKNVKLYPEQYMWVHKRFKTRPEGDNTKFY